MTTSILTDRDIDDIFRSHAGDSPFKSLAVCTAGLHKLTRLQRTFQDQQNPAADRQQARQRWLALEPRLYAYLRQKTPLSLFDSDYHSEMTNYIRLRLIWLDSQNGTFVRHRLELLLDLLRLCRNDLCQDLPGRDILADQLEIRLFHEYLLYDMSLKNTQYVGREAVSNGYHECDFTLEIEDILKEPHQAVPPCQFRYVCHSLTDSHMAACTAFWLYEHHNQLRHDNWLVDDSAIERLYKNSRTPVITSAMLKVLEAVYGKKSQL